VSQHVTRCRKSSQVLMSVSGSLSRRVAITISSWLPPELKLSGRDRWVRINPGAAPEAVQLMVSANLKVDCLDPRV
jgi:hypothetical protein